MNKWKAINDFNLSETKSKNINQNTMQKQKSKNNDNNYIENKECNKSTSLILDHILNSGNISTAKFLKFGVKKKSPLNNFKIQPSFESNNEENIDWNKPKTPNAKFNINPFGKIDEKSCLTFRKKEKNFAINENNFFVDFEKESNFTKTALNNFVIDENGHYNESSKENKINPKIRGKELIENSENKESKFLNPFLIKINTKENYNFSNNNSNLNDITNEKIDTVDKTLNEMDIVK
jgi:hypothetical protein